MSFSFRTPAELFVQSLPKEYAEACFKSHAANFQIRSDKGIGLFDFACSSVVKERLTKAGIPVSAFCNQEHSHPASKMIENHLLYNILPNYLNLKNYTAISIKDSKVRKLLKNGVDSLETFNRLFSCKDALRYVDPETCDMDKFIARVHHSTRIFLFDELHYWSMNSLSDFLDRSNVKELLATIVFPIEILLGSKRSLNPELYEFEISRGKLHFFPDGCTSESYSQPKDCDILKVNRIVTKTGKIFSVELIHTIGANHMVMIKEGSFDVDSERFFDRSSALTTSLLMPTRAGKALRIRRKFLLRLIIYLFSLKKPDHHSAIAKIRQSSDDSIFCDEIMLADHVGKIFEKLDPASPFGVKGVFDLLTSIFKDIFLLDGLFNWSDRRKSEKFVEFMRALDYQTNKVVTCTFSGGVMRSGFLAEFFLDNDCEASEGLDEVISRFDTFFDPKKEYSAHALRVNIKDRTPNPYGPMKARTPSVVLHREYITKVEFSSKAKKVNVLKERLTGEVSFEEARLQRMWHSDSQFVAGLAPKLRYVKMLTWKKDQKLFSEFPSEESNEVEMEDAFEYEEKENSEEEGPKERDENGANSEECEQLDSEDDVGSFEYEETKADSYEIDFEAILNRVNSGGLRGVCLLDALAKITGTKREITLSILLGRDGTWADWFLKDKGATFDDVFKAVSDLDLNCTICTKEGSFNAHVNRNYKHNFLYLFDEHVSLERPKVMLFEQVRHQKIDFLGAFEKCPGAGKFRYEALAERGSLLASALKDNLTGVISSKFNWDPKCEFVDIEKEILVVAGFAGSGKTRGICQIVKSMFNNKKTLVLSPRKNLADDWVKNLANLHRPSHVKVMTFEAGLRRVQKSSLIVIDELSLMPNGYLDMLINMNEEATFITLFDPLQARYHAKSDVLRVSPENDVDRIKVPKYLFFSKRMSSELDFFDVRCSSDQKKWELHGKQYREPAALFRDIKGQEFTILSPSFETAREMSKYADIKDGCKSMTFGESQGLTVNKAVIVVDQDLVATSVLHWIVALTRSRQGFVILVHKVFDMKTLIQPVQNSIIGLVLRGVKVSREHLINTAGKCLSEAEIVEELETFKRTEEDEDLLEGDPWLKGQLFLCQSVELDEVTPEEPLRHESPPRTHLPLPVEGLTPLLMSNVKAREDREFITPSGWSKQFRDDKENVDWRNVSYADAFETIYPKHEASDDITLWAAIQKRIVMADPFRNAMKLQKVEPISAEIFNEMNKILLLNPHVSVDRDQVYKEFLRKRLNKSKKLIESHSERSSDDWPIDHFFLFMKSQLCTKFEKRFVDAKAGQTLACFSHKLLTRFGPAFREFEKKFTANLPPSWYIHTMKNFDQLNNWVINYVDQEEGTESDYEAFDRSQDAIILGLEIECLKLFGWDQDLIDDYRKLKLWMGCRLGAIAIMRFTGEFGTFFFNTIANIAFTCLRYNITRDTVIAFAGDDMYASGKLEIRKDREDLLAHLTLKAKVQFTEKPMFCGWYIKKMGIVKEPRLVLERWLIAERKKVIDQCFINYSIEVSYGYRLGEYLWEYFDNLEDFQAIVRLVIKKKKQLPPAIRRIFETSNGVDFSGEVQETMGGEGEHHGSCGLWCNLH
uniref:RNA-dependent RNA polymerase n=2 Tax=Potato virus T TaxID=36403 RepID=A0A3S8XG24_9VIRU|nr:RNA-dependent RNA polymerase [Potato virus T]